jgi:hypothetical protein
MNNKLEQFTSEQLKAMAYDEMAKLEVAQNNLRILNQEIAKRVQEIAKQLEVEQRKES